MPTVWIPSLLRELTQGQEKVSVPGETVRQMIANLDQRYPGIQARLCDEDGRLRSNLALVVDGAVSNQRMRHKLTDTSEVRFMPAISGGCTGSWTRYFSSAGRGTAILRQEYIKSIPAAPLRSDLRVK